MHRSGRCVLPARLAGAVAARLGSAQRSAGALAPLTKAIRSNSSSSTTRCQASKKDAAPKQSGDAGGAVGSVGLFLLWGGLAAYAFLLSPNQTPLRDSYFIEKFVGLANDEVPLNAVFTQLFYVMGVWPLIYTALLVPAGKSANGVPAWPFFTLSYAVGAFGLLPFMALWQPPATPPQLPPAKEDLEGTGNLLARGMESPVIAWLLLAGAAACLIQAATAGGDAWVEYIRLARESRLVHVTTLDFLTLTALAPFWMDNDATLRKWEGRDSLLLPLSLLPVLGPAIYLVLRPKAEQ